jgi:hypothetical protein
MRPGDLDQGSVLLIQFVNLDPRKRVTYGCC